MTKEEKEIKKLKAEVAQLKDYIRREGEVTGTCTYDVLKELCEGCRCQKGTKEVEVL